MRNAIAFIFGIMVVVAVGAWCKKRCANIPENIPEPRTVTYRVTAYCPCRKCCGRWADGFTASGRPARGKVAAAPPEIPFGTWIYVPGYGWAEVLDRGGSIKGKRLDVLFDSHEEAVEWGVQYLEIEETWSFFHPK